ncbi:hypothetical protein EI168_03950 [Halomonas sp. FME1]|uniref:PIN domain-containing protein n=2 Tax=Halomonas TaxID=2745 RepID=A0ABR9EYU7_9GAMM|nr:MULTISPECIES: DUF6190 family protein [Halomonas]MBE0399264.1 hypothetical protein [Halomonas casei]PCC21760.1 hypothetical protein CIK78_06610 [Halomonas sp. JB37]
MVPIIDASVFLGMHHESLEVREKCVEIIVRNFDGGLEINLEQIGLCDNVIWQRSREEQNAYYPFMSYLHTVMEFKRIPYADEAYQLAAIDYRLKHLPMKKAILACHVLAGERGLYTLDDDLKDMDLLSDYIMPIISSSETEYFFSEPLNLFYKKSLMLKLKSEEISI